MDESSLSESARALFPYAGADYSLFSLVIYGVIIYAIFYMVVSVFSGPSYYSPYYPYYYYGRDLEHKISKSNARELNAYLLDELPFVTDAIEMKY